MPNLLRLEDGALIEGAGVPDLVLTCQEDLAASPPALEGVSVVAIELPKFKDGRAFTQARLLRQRFGFGGEIRATGHILPDQVQFLARLGVTAVELEDEDRLDDFRRGLESFRYAYQRPSETLPVFALRGQS